MEYSMSSADSYDEETLMSYDEWKEAGYCVLKGARMRCRDAVGVPQFSKDQTTMGLQEWEAENGIEEIIPVQSERRKTFNSNYKAGGFLTVGHFEEICHKHHGQCMFEGRDEGYEFFDQDM